MKSIITPHQLNQLILYINKNYQTFGTQKNDGKVVFDALKKPSGLVLGEKKPIIILKNLLFPRLLRPNSHSDLGRSGKSALLGLNNCDVWSLHYLLEEFQGADILPKREDILIVAAECTPQDSCFCGLMGTNKLADFDLFIQEEKNGWAIFSGTKRGLALLKTMGLKKSSFKSLEIKKIQPDYESISPEKLSSVIEHREKLQDYWTKISNNCFGCGSCTAVCPLCYCTRQDYQNGIDGSSIQCLNWDTCFAKRFSEIQNHYDLRPNNVDRLYNWYHHKFVRSYFKKKHFLCTGCGRCIDACPANLNQKTIIETALKKEELQQ